MKKDEKRVWILQQQHLSTYKILSADAVSQLFFSEFLLKRGCWNLKYLCIQYHGFRVFFVLMNSSTVLRVVTVIEDVLFRCAGCECLW